MTRPLHAVLLAGGEGKRMNSPLPKVLIDLLGRPVLGHVLDAVGALSPRSRVIVAGRHLPAIRREFAGERDVSFVRQASPLGTAHAVKQALKVLPRRGADVLIMNGDGPLVTEESLRRIVAQHRASRVDVTLATAEVSDPKDLGRIVRDSGGRFSRIVETKDASAEELRIREINSGQYVVRAEALHRLILHIGRKNRQGEYYLTDIVALAKGSVATFALPDPDEWRGINDPGELDTARRALRSRAVARLRSHGVVFVDPDLTYVEPGVNVGEGTVIMPFTVLRRGATIAAHCVVGPFAQLRHGAVLEEGSRIGNFVEVKASRVGRGSKVMHLAYLGDARVGEGVNVGAGTITANFDGRRKQATVIGDGASLGSGTILVAPVVVGENACTGAGAVVLARRDVPAGETVVGVPASPVNRSGATRPLRRRRRGGGRTRNGTS